MVTSNSWQRILASISAPERSGKTLDEILRHHSAVVAKRLLDITVALMGLVAVSPLMLMIAVAIMLDSRGPALYISRRIGRNGQVFSCFRFRTMTAGGQETRVSPMLRRYGLDELPQLVNVLCGQMSLVGPRPVLLPESSSVSVGHFRRFEMTPGMTGLWAVHEAHQPPFHYHVSAHDTYRRNWSIWLDVVIVMRSVAAALVGKGR